MSTHTPGPWTTKRGDHGGYSVESNGRLTYPASKAICTVRPYPRTAEAHGEAEATARLIAAAPDLLVLAREALSVAIIHKLPHFESRARAVIQKAERTQKARKITRAEELKGQPLTAIEIQELDKR